MTYAEPQERKPTPGREDGQEEGVDQARGAGEAQAGQGPRPTEDQAPDGYWPGMPDYPAKARAAQPGPTVTPGASGGQNAALPGIDPSAGAANDGQSAPGHTPAVTGAAAVSDPALTGAANGSQPDQAPGDLPARPGAARTFLRSELTNNSGAGRTGDVPPAHGDMAPSDPGMVPGVVQAARPTGQTNTSTPPWGYRPAAPASAQPSGQNQPVAQPAASKPPPASSVNRRLPANTPSPSRSEPAARYRATTPGRSSAGGRPAGLPGRPGGTAYQGGMPPRGTARARRRVGCGGALGMGLFALALVLLVFGGLLFGYVGIASALPSPEDLQARASQFASTQIFDRQGQILNEIADPAHGRRTAVTLDQISKNLLDATIATEDPNFYQHPGVDPVGLARAVYYAVKDRDISGPGGSTITQQLVKLVYLSPERTASRKIKEAVLAAEITRRYDKNTVLQIYLNEIYYGNLAYGIEAASETYFGKPAKDLDLAEAAMLGGLPQAPAYYDPYTRLWEADGQPGLVKKRQGVVLGLMVRHGSITPEQADAAWKEPLKLKPLQQSYTMKSPHFVYFVRSDVEKALGPAMLAKGGLKIYTTLDPKLQAVAEQEVAAQVRKLNAQRATDGALVAVRPATGEILAMVGSADFNNEKIGGQINMAVMPRQPGSSIKPLTYLTAFSMPPTKIEDKTEPSDTVSALEPPGAWTPSTAILDIRTEFPDGNGRPPYVPKNYDGKEHGVVSVRSALANSYNIPAVKALQHVGLDALKDTATKLGITTLTRPDYGLALTLGGGEVTLLEMTGAYATLANNGSRAPLNEIACVVDANGQAIWRGNAADQVQGCQNAKHTGPLLVNPEPARPAVDPQAAYLITSILSDLEARRPAFGSSAELLSLPDRPAAAKTGTTNDNRDGWTLGYTPDLAVGVWIGNADYSAMQDVAGSAGAAPIWHNVMQHGLQGVPAKQFVAPQGIQRVKVCAETGTLPSEACPAQREELFASDRGPLPARFDLHQRLRIDKATGQLASEFTPPDRVETKDFLVFPPRYRDWANAHGFTQPDLDLRKYAFPPELMLNSPGQNSEVGGVVPVMGRVHLPDPLVWRLEYGVGPNPIGWGVLREAQKGDVEGSVGDWDAGATVDAHEQRDFSLRLAAYDPSNAAYPVAVSNIVYVTVASPTPEPTATASPTLLPTATPTPLATVTPAATPTDIPAPTATASPTPDNPGPSPTPGITATPPGESAGSVVAAILQPADGARLPAEPMPILGIAAGTDFQSYQLDFAPAVGPRPDTWLPLLGPQTQPSPPEGGLLGTWPGQDLPPGAYLLRLTVVDRAGQAHIAIVQIQTSTANGG